MRYSTTSPEARPSPIMRGDHESHTVHEEDAWDDEATLRAERRHLIVFKTVVVLITVLLAALITASIGVSLTNAPADRARSLSSEPSGDLP